MRSRAAGFTIVELLVVIAIIGTLAGLLLPAVQAARESGRRASCRNNIGQIAKAMVQFETSMSAFPSGGWGNLWLPSPNRGGELKQTGGWTFGILPFLEQQPLRDLIEQANAGSAADVYKTALATPIAAFTCPSRRSASPATTRSGVQFRSSLSTTLSIPSSARADYSVNGGSGAACPPLYVLQGVAGTGSTSICCSQGGGRQTVTLDVTTIFLQGHAREPDDHLGECNSCGNPVMRDQDNPDTVQDGDTWSREQAAAKLVGRHNPIPDFQDGIVHRMSRIVPAKILDGLSNTYLLAEKYVPKEGYNASGGSSDMGDDPLLAGFGNHNVRWAYDQPANDRDDGVAGGANAGREANAMGSAHAGTFTVAYADGSVQELSTSIDISVHRRLASRADGQPVERP